MPKDSKHASTTEFSRKLCDLMLACFPDNLEQSRKFSTTRCAAHISTRKSALYWVSHSKKHIEVFLRCDDTSETIHAIQSNLPSGVVLKQRPHPRKGIAISTPLFFFVDTEDQARNMGPFLRLLSSSDLDSKILEPEGVASYWTPNSERTDPEFEARRKAIGSQYLSANMSEIAKTGRDALSNMVQSVLLVGSISSSHMGRLARVIFMSTI